MKKIIILGASVLQLPGILTAKEMGLYTISVDMNPDSIGRKFADEFYQISTTDKKKVLEIATLQNIDGIMTLASDQPMNTVSYVSSKLNLTAISQEVARNTTNKGFMRNKLKENNVPIPNYQVVSNEWEFNQVLETQKLPCIAKPTDSSGSRGVQLVHDLKDLDKKFLYSSKHSKNQEVIIEEYLQGREFSVESISTNGRTEVIAITEKQTSGPPYFVELAHMVPANISSTEEKKISDIVKLTTKSLDIQNGPSHCEVMLTNEGPKIIEIGARLGGDNITSHLVPLSTGYNMIKASISCAINQVNTEKVLCKNFTLINYIDSDENGEIYDITGLNQIENSPNLIELNLSKKIGDIHNKVTSSSERIGYFILSGKSRNLILAEADRLRKQVKIIFK